MTAIFFVIFMFVGSTFCRSLPSSPEAPPQPEQASSIDVASVKGNPAELIRKARQFGYYNNFDYNPYNDTPNNYDNNPFNDSFRRQTFNNFDLNPFNDSYNNYDANPYNNSGFFGKKKK